MPRPREVQFFYDDATGAVVVKDRSGVRVLREIGAGRKAANGRKRGKRRRRPPKAEHTSVPTGKPRGRPRKARTEEKKSE
jgi:hypothetical protein